MQTQNCQGSLINRFKFSRITWVKNKDNFSNYIQIKYLFWPKKKDFVKEEKELQKEKTKGKGGQEILLRETKLKQTNPWSLTRD